MNPLVPPSLPAVARPRFRLSRTHRTGLVWVLACALASAAVAGPAAPPRLALWVTAPLGATDGSQCAQAAGAALPDSAPTLTDDDVLLWDVGSAQWLLDGAYAQAPAAEWALQDHCFVLGLDGRLLASGLVLSSHSARRTALATLRVESRGKTTWLQLSDGMRSPPAPALHEAVLGSVFAQRAHLQVQLQRLNQAADSDPYAALQDGTRWRAAVQNLIDTGRLHKGLPVADVLALLGPPSSSKTPDYAAASSLLHWYFNTPRHVNPLFVAEVRDAVLVDFGMSSR